MSKLNEFVSLPACVVSQLTKVRRFKLESPDSSVSKLERFVAAAKEIPALFRKRFSTGKLSMQPETISLRMFRNNSESQLPTFD